MPADPNTVVNVLKISITTGGDDLRGGSQAWAYVHLLQGSAVSEFSSPLNEGANWKNNTTHERGMDLPNGTTLRDIRRFGIKFQSGGGVSGDNWNVDRIVVKFAVPGGEDELVNLAESPIVRFKSTERTEWGVNFNA
jgi:hypothetical protein